MGFASNVFNTAGLAGSFGQTLHYKPITEEDFAERLARKRIYHPKEFDQELKDIEAENFKYPLPTPNHAPASFKGIPILDILTRDVVVNRYNKAFKSKTYQDAMKNYELRQRFPDRYVPAGFESLQNLDMYAARGQALQRRGILGRRRAQSLGGEQAPQEVGL